MDGYFKIRNIFYDKDLPTAKHVITYIDREQKIHAYITKVKTWLTQFALEINQFNWKIKNIWRKWVEGRPKHVNYLIKILEKIGPSSSRNEVLDAYNQVNYLISNIPVSTRRHFSTLAFYKKAREEIKAMNFDTTVDIYQNQPVLFATSHQLYHSPVSDVMQPFF